MAGLGLALVGCSDAFTPPDLPDLKKAPYDLGVAIPPYRSDMGPGSD